MCFRPPETGVEEFKCPSCGKVINPTGGFVLKKCPFCKNELPDPDIELKPVAPQRAPETPPGAPQAPKA